MLWIINVSIFMSNAGDEFNLSATEEGFMSMSFMVGMLIGSYA